jgi:replication factor C small subunit
MKHDLWVEKYRPNDFDNYVWRDEKQREQMEELIKKGNLPHLLFSGSPGIGKTTLAKALLYQLKVDNADVLELNGSVDNGIDVIRERITNFVSKIGFAGVRYVLFDEADYLTQNAQASMRNLMETYSAGARFILTANYPHKIIPALKSRCQQYHFQELDKDNFTIRAATVLAEEGIEFEIEVLDAFVTATYPDLRKCINLLQQYSVKGELQPFVEDDAGTPEWYGEMVVHFIDGKINEARKVIVANIVQEEFEDLYRFLYENLDYFGDTEEQKMEAILVIREGLVNHAICADSEINLAATLVKLAMIK